MATEFKCWWYRGEEALALAFLQNLNAILGTTLKDKVKGLVPQIGRGILQAGPVIGTAAALTPMGPVGTVVGGAMGFASRFFPDGEPLEETFQKLASILEAQDRRFLVVIDDLDRLSAEEALAVFRLIKSVGRLPNVMYLVVFDRQLAKQAVKEKYPSEGPHFLEKIIQASFEIPSPLPDDLNYAVLSTISEICGEPAEDRMTRFMNIFYDVLAPYISSPRHVARFQNAISVTWPAIAGEVDLGDFVGLETIRLYEPGLFFAIKANKGLLCGSRQDGDAGRDVESRFDVFLKNVPEISHELAKTTLQRLFPRLEGAGYGHGWLDIWGAERRVCVEAHFDTYFRLSLSEETLSSQLLADLIRKADDREFVQEKFRSAAKIEHRTGKSQVPIFLDELITHAKHIDADKVEALITSLFEIHDEIDMERDAGRGMSFENTTLRYHWLIRRLTHKRFSIEERTKIYLSATETAPLGWLVDFVASADSDHVPREDQRPSREEECLVEKEALPLFKERAVKAIRLAASNGSLITHSDLLSILYRWKEFLDDNSEEVRQWTESKLRETTSLVALVRAMTGTRWSVGMGGFGMLGDRVGICSTTVRIDENTEIIDPQTFRKALEEAIDRDQFNETDQELVVRFLEAWDHQKSKPK